MTGVTFFVAGVPVPQGSKTGYVVKGRAVLADANGKKLKPWRNEVARIARASWADRAQMAGPVRVEVIFVFARPKTVRRERPSVKPDLDKTVRAILDSLTAAGIWRDDAQVTDLSAQKVYGAAPGAHVTIIEAAS